MSKISYRTSSVMREEAALSCILLSSLDHKRQYSIEGLFFFHPKTKKMVIHGAGLPRAFRLGRLYCSNKVLLQSWPTVPILYNNVIDHSIFMSYDVVLVSRWYYLCNL